MEGASGTSTSSTLVFSCPLQWISPSCCDPQLARMSSRLPFRCGYASFGTGRAVHSEAAPPAEEPPRIPAIVDLFEVLRLIDAASSYVLQK
ncbi:hypothetical protein AK812_SmicGene10061 [Symbiodinium microadriaticum]|uniref:Uncharacterized protein n=1 Tax=Symbiodinium microadriaticum TaxID=2951 RepID=A0A1Q9EGP3_SYMMI|nr:hypothetical protein AK812_SmicGene10061 [Symbiodinium microadriaticum]